MTSPGVRYRVGVFEFDARSLELWKEGRLLRLRPQAARLLGELLEHPGEVVLREDIRQALWPGDTFVDFEQGVNHCVTQLRAALGDTAESPRFIQTLPRRGYRFIAPVARVEPRPEMVSTAAEPFPAAREATVPEDVVPPAERPSRRRPAWLLPAAALALLLLGAAGPLLWARATNASRGTPGDVPVLLVRPFSVSGVDPWFGAGLADAVAQRLGGSGLLVLGPVAQRGRDSSQVLPASGAVLDGEIVRLDDGVVVTARLQGVTDRRVTWSERISARPDALFNLEDTVAARVAAALSLRIAAADQERLRRRYTGDPVAYEDYLRGRAALVAYTPEGTRQAADAFARAVARDPSYALARAGLAMAAADMYLRFATAADIDGWGERADAEARAALTLDGSLAEAHLARAAVARKREFDWRTVIEESQRALILNPALEQAHFFAAAAFYHLGFMEEATRAAQLGRAVHGPDEIEPLRIESLIALFSGEYTSARVRLEELSRRSSQAIGDVYLALASHYAGDPARGRRMLEALSTQASVSTASRAGAALAALRAADGDAAAGRALVARVEAASYRDHHVAYWLGAAHAQLGDESRAVRWLRVAADTGFPCLPWFERDPLLDPLRDRPAFGALLEAVRAHRDALAETLRPRS
jgi:DNA-binding winged helix-turn-helix (wHTH) protein/TolB-like protein